MTTTMTVTAEKQQLELGFNGGHLPAFPRRGNRAARANWWFAQMRAAVGRAIDWSVATDPRLEQIWMPGTHRHVEL